MEVLTPVEALRAYRQSLAPTDSVALVPTMGALHAGHRALIDHARRLADRVVVSIFVNPLQFGPNEDFTRYPRPVDSDLEQCRQAGVDAVFLPTPEVMYPNGREASGQTIVVPPAALTDRLCGLSRPGHFTGVATVVLKLFNLVQPHVAIFGEKDAQQLAIIQWMVADLNVPVSVVAHPIVRDPDGLALSSRNQYLEGPQQRQSALLLPTLLRRVAKLGLMEPETPLKALQAKILADLQAESPVAMAQFQLEYLEAVDAESFSPQTHVSQTSRLLAAARVGSVRLIDNGRVQALADAQYVA
jgi:pantoate ligase/cytidylate kinase